MNPLNAAVSVLSESNDSQNSFRHRWYKFPLCALFLMLALLVSRAAYATTYTVTDLTDSASDTGSLRYAVNTAANGDTINFAPNLIGTITLTNGTLALNSGGVTIAGPGANLLTISGNNAATVFTVNATGAVSISGLAIADGNTATGGGGIEQDSYGTLNVSNCAFLDNTAAGAGGGIANLGGTLTVANSTFVGNSAGAGGGIAVVGATTVQNSTFLSNSSIGGGPGGAMFDQGTLVVNNSTITGNSVDGIFVNSTTPAPTLSLSNSIVSGNASGLDCERCGTQSANNLIGGSAGLGPLQYNGGITETMMPLPGSPAIGAGSGSTLATDQRGFARSTSGTSDLGAVSTNYLTVTTTADTTDTTTCTGGATCSLRDAIDAVNSAGSGDIVFQSGVTGTITLGSVLADITANLDLQGPGANKLTVSGANNGNNVAFRINSGTVNISGLTIANSNTVFGGGGYVGGAMYNNATLTLSNCAISNNIGGDGAGAIGNQGTMTINNCTISNNTAAENTGGGIVNEGTMIVENSTISGNATSSSGGGIYDMGTLMVNNSTIVGNTSSGGQGGGISYQHGMFGGSLTIINSIVTGNTGGDCANCGTQGPANMIGGSPDLGVLALNGLNATVQTMLPLPGSPAIQAGDPTRLPAGLMDDQRGFPRTTGGKLDLGAAQTNYTSVQFVQQPTNTVFNTDIDPAVTLEVLETNPNLASPNNTDAVNGISIPLTFNGTGTLGGTLAQTTAGGVASFGDLKVGSTVGTGNTLATSLTVTPTGVTPPVTLTATSNPFNITLETQTITFTPPPANVTYGVAPITLAATSSASLPVTFQVDSGQAMISGNILTITGGGTVEVEADAAGNGTYMAAAPVVETILIAQATSSLALTASANSATPGTSVTLTATVTSATPGTTATPTGTVTFLTAAGPLGTANLNAQGVATLAVTTLPVGSTAIEASYSGDANFIGSGGQLATPIVVGTPTFTMTSSASSLSIQPGQAGTVTLTLTPSFGYTGTVNFACNGLPLHSTCSFSPTSVTLNGSASPVTVTLTVATSVKGQARSNLARLTPLHPLRNLPILPAIFFWLPGSRLALDEDERNRQPRMKKKSFRMLLAALLLVLGAGMLSLTGCSSGMSYNTPAGSQTVTITATGSGGVSQSIAVQVAIQ